LIGIEDKRYFQGLTSLAAAALIAGSIWLVINAGSKIQMLAGWWL